MNPIEPELHRLLSDGETVAMATILSRAGSAPRLAGTRMLIRRDGSIVGTIGGGLLEADVMAAAPAALESGRPEIRHFDLNFANADDRMDMICGGKVSVLLERMEPDPTLQRILDALLDTRKAGRTAFLAATLPTAGESVARALLLPDGTILGDGRFPEPLLPQLAEAAGRNRAPAVIEMAGRAFLVEPTVSAGTVYLFGAGHVSREVARLAVMTGFRTVVLDDRAEFANRDRFPEADEVRVLADFEQPMDRLEIGPDAFIVIVTRGHSHDRTVLAQALKTDAGYIGMIGSRRKRDGIYAALRKTGVTDDQIARVHCPIGIPIGAETPEEIGVSIVGQLIAERAARR
jgi:xanthine dehydrogenase accessory factor